MRPVHRVVGLLPPLGFLVVLLGAWELYVRTDRIEDYVLPAPTRVGREFFSMAPDLGRDVWITTVEAVAGLTIGALVGVALALAIARYAFARRAIYPVLVVSQTVPAIVLAPVLVVWLGFEELTPKIVVVALVTFFPVVVSTVDGLVNADREQLDLVRSYGGSRAQQLRLVQIPSALPAFFAGLKIAATYAVVGAVIAEWMGASHGLGLVMERSRTAFRNDRVFVAVVVVALLSLVLFALVRALGHAATPWLAATLALVLVVTGCGGDDDSAADDRTGEMRHATLVLNWTPNAHHLGVYAAAERGWYEDAGIDLEIVESATGGTAEPAVGNGEAEFGISIAEAVLPARAEDIPIVSIATILPVNDSALMSLAEDGIEQPSDLAGATYGGYGGPLETEIINTLAECGGVDPTAVRHVEVGNVDYLAGMDADRFDAAWIFSGWDALRATEVEGVDVDLLRFEDHFDCIPNWYTPLFIASEDLLADDPELVRDFLEVTTRGYELAVEDPHAAAESMLDAVPEMDETLLRAAADYYATRFTVDGAPFGTQERAVWATFEAFLRTAGSMDEAVVVDDAFTNEFLPSG
ncbi:MAG: ABC transporter substrate-binding protein [Actinomycetota bacterium]